MSNTATITSQVTRLLCRAHVHFGLNLATHVKDDQLSRDKLMTGSTITRRKKSKVQRMPRRAGLPAVLGSGPA